MNKASSALLATAGVTVGLLGFALPAGAAVAHGPNSQPGQSQSQTTGFQGPNSSNNNNSTWGGQKNGGDKRGWGGQRNPCPTKPCEPVQTKPCPTKTKPCAPKCKKGSGHKHHQHPQNSGLN